MGRRDDKVMMEAETSRDALKEEEGAMNTGGHEKVKEARKHTFLQSLPKEPTPQTREADFRLPISKTLREEVCIVLSQ